MTINLRPCAATCGPCPPTQSLTLMNLTVDEGCPGALAGSDGIYLDVGPIECAWSCTAGVMTITVDRIRYFDGTAWNVVSGPFTPKSGYFWANTDPCGGCTDGTPYWNCGDPEADPPVVGTVWIQLDDLVGAATLAEQYEIVEVICDDTTVNIANDDPDPGEWVLSRQTVKQDYSRSTATLINCTEGAAAITAQGFRLITRAVGGIYEDSGGLSCTRTWTIENVDPSGCGGGSSCSQDVDVSSDYTTHTFMSAGSCRNVVNNANTPNEGAATLAATKSVSQGEEMNGCSPGGTASFAGSASWKCGTVRVVGTMSVSINAEPLPCVLQANQGDGTEHSIPMTEKIYFHDCTKCWFRVFFITKIERVGASSINPRCAGFLYKWVRINQRGTVQIQYGKDAA